MRCRVACSAELGYPIYKVWESNVCITVERSNPDTGMIDRAGRG